MEHQKREKKEKKIRMSLISLTIDRRRDTKSSQSVIYSISLHDSLNEQKEKRYEQSVAELRAKTPYAGKSPAKKTRKSRTRVFE